jgi:hypothetical protein
VAGATPRNARPDTAGWYAQPLITSAGSRCYARRKSGTPDCTTPAYCSDQLLVLKVLLPAVMEIMGWSDPSIAKRYIHVSDELLTALAHDVGELLWTKRPASK